MAGPGSERRFYLAVLGPFVLAIAALAAVVVVGFSVLSAARAYVAGESLWSKGRSAAVAALRSYALHGVDADYHRFEAALVVPLGDRQARLALDRSEPDLAAARAGFIAGDNAADDIPGMIRLFRYGRHVGFMRDAITAIHARPLLEIPIMIFGNSAALLLIGYLAATRAPEDSASLKERFRLRPYERRDLILVVIGMLGLANTLDDLLWLLGLANTGSLKFLRDAISQMSLHERLLLVPFTGVLAGACVTRGYGAVLALAASRAE